MNEPRSSLSRRHGLKLALAGLAVGPLSASSLADAAIEEEMTITSVQLERYSLTSSKPFDAIVSALKAAIGQPNIAGFLKAAGSAQSFAELERLVQSSVGRSGLMLFAEFDLGAILRSETGSGKPRIVRLIVGNPLIMKEMVKHVPDAGSYTPTTILVDERRDGVHVSYDKMESLLVPYRDPEALAVARNLDAKVEGLLRECTS